MVDRLDLRDVHKQRHISPDHVQLIPGEDPAILSLGTDEKTTRNTRWFAEVARAKEGIGLVSSLMRSSGKQMLPKDMPLVDLFREYRKVHDKWFNEEESAKVSKLIDER